MDLSELFDSLTPERLADWVKQRQEEHVQLDFKTVASADLSRGEDKKNLAKALAGFANGDGGIVVWGIDARKDEDEVDRASEFKLIPNVARFLSRLNEFTATSVSPMVGGVRHRSILMDGDAGCAISLVPASDVGPHMAKASEDRYYKRSGDSFRRMEHFDVADMFGRRARPVLKFATRIVGGGGSSGGGPTVYNGKLTFGVENIGRGIAKSIYLAVRSSSGYLIDPFGIDGNRSEGLPRIVQAIDHASAKYGGTQDIVVHPGVMLEVGAVHLKAAYWAADGKLEMPAPLTVVYEIAAEGFPLEKGEVTLDADEIASAVYPRTLYVPNSERLATH
ncbi:MAG: AlbA family DNA-binding domain-containing protein [Gemmatimonadaceae bacterium]